MADRGKIGKDALGGLIAEWSLADALPAGAETAAGLTRRGEGDPVVPGQTIDGGAGDEVLRGGAGNDELTGAEGRDTLFGGDGDDEIWVGFAIDIGPAASGAADPTAFRDVVFAGAGNDLVVGDGGRDLARGGAGNDELLGRGGDDLLFGGRGADELQGMAGDDTLQGGANADRLRGGGGEDLLGGGAGRDRLFGGAGDDAIRGGGGADRLSGGAGDDMLKGGAGRDVFTFRADFGDDVIADYQDGVDRIAIFDIEAAESFAALRIEQVGDDAIISFGDGTVTLTGLDASLLTAEDFVF